MKSALLLILFPFIAHGQIANPSFEEWYTDSQGNVRLIGWQHVQKSNTPTTFAGTARENNSQHLNSAIRISRWYDYTWDKILQYTPIYSTPSKLSGYYIYTNNELIGEKERDTACICVYLTKWSVAHQRTDTLAKGRVELGPSVNYRRFECNFQYLLAGQPDSIYLDISPSKWEGFGTFCKDSPYCSFLTIDNLSLEGNTNAASVNLPFPNPADHLISYFLPGDKEGSAVIFNSIGQTLQSQRIIPGMNHFKIESWSPGLYIMKIIAGSEIFVHKFIRQ